MDRAEARPAGWATQPRSVHASLQAADPHRFVPGHRVVRAGQTIEIVLHNRSSVRHELVIGDRAQQGQYGRSVKAMPGTRHEHDNVLIIEPGRIRSVVWQFGDAKLVELACHIDGHYEQGMMARVNVQP